MSKKPKATENTAKDVETAKVNKAKRKELAAELGELTLLKAKLVGQVNQITERQRQLAEEMEQLANDGKK